MKMQEGKNYQPVMIRYLNQNKGRATKKDIQEALHNANPKYPTKYFQNSVVFEVLEGRHVVNYNSANKTYNLLDYEMFSAPQKAHITMYCDEKIRNSANPVNPRIILFSVAGKKSFEHFNETITKDVITNTLPLNTILKNFHAVRAWGSIYNSQNFSKWKELKKGDILLFYHNKKYVTCAILDGTEQNQSLANYLWGFKDEESKKTFELILYMSPTFVFNEDVDYHKLNKLFGYEEEFMPTRILDFTTVNKNKTDELIEKFGSLENALKTIGFSLSNSNSSDLERLILEFDKDRHISRSGWGTPEEREKIRNEMLAKFPPNAFLRMKIEDYVEGTQRDDTFCYYLINIPGFGALGRFSRKFGVYWKKSENRYYFERYPDYETAFEEVKHTIDGLIRHGQDFEKTRDWLSLATYFKNSDKIIRTDVKSKILGVYFPDSFISIHSLKALRKILETFGVSFKKIENNHMLLQEKIIKIKNSHPIMKNWDNRDYSRFLWSAIVTGEEVHDEKLEADEIDVIETKNYLLLRHSSGSVNQWQDDIGKKYHYGRIPNYTKLVPGSKTIWYDREDGDFYYWGYGDISRIEKELEDRQYAYFDNFAFFNEPGKEKPKTEDVIPKKGADSIKEKIMNLPGWNNQISMLEITKDIYDEIVNGRIMSQLPEITPTRSVSDGKLRIPTKDEVKKGIKEIQKELLIEDSIIEEVVTHLASGRHVLLAGPVGTGKTRLSQLIPEMFWTENSGYFADVRTATADWNTQDVIGGISPKITDNPISPLTYEFENGCVTDTVLANYEKESRKTDHQVRHTSIHRVNDEEKQFNGTWLVIDEFNRADIDKAFGQLFTALEYGDLKIQDIRYEKTVRTVKIPEDYRIIGTLNTADKHYLFSLSDALKRRFAYIEISIPSKKDKEREIFLAAKNALKDLDQEKLQDIIKIGKDSEDFDSISESLKEKLDYAYNVLEIIRPFKPLGTAVLKLIYQNLITAEKIGLNNSFDNAINANLLPQLETLPKPTIRILYEYLFSKPITSNEETIFPGLANFLNNETQKEQYQTGFEAIVRYLDYSEDKIQDSLKKFTNGDIPTNLTKEITEMKKSHKMTFDESSLFKKSLEEILKQSEF